MTTSFCTYQASVDVYWRYCAGETQSDHIEAIVDALFAALCGPNRRWSPWNRPLVRAELRDRIEQAAMGQLVPVDHVKSLRGGRTGMFEIRWTSIGVLDEDPPGTQRHYDTEARLIHAEPSDELGIALLGLVAHEKPKADGAKDLQDEKIDEAEGIFNGGFASTWGVSPRSGSRG